MGGQHVGRGGGCFTLVFLDFPWIWVDFSHVHLHFSSNFACFGSRHDFLGCVENPKKIILDPICANFDKECKSTCKRSTQIQWKSSEIHSEAPTTSSHMPSPSRPQRHVGRWWVLHYGSFQISFGFGWISCTWIRTYMQI